MNPSIIKKIREEFERYCSEFYCGTGDCYSPFHFFYDSGDYEASIDGYVDGYLKEYAATYDTPGQIEGRITFHPEEATVFDCNELKSIDILNELEDITFDY